MFTTGNSSFLWWFCTRSGFVFSIQFFRKPRWAQSSFNVGECWSDAHFVGIFTGLSSTFWTSKRHCDFTVSAHFKTISGSCSASRRLRNYKLRIGVVELSVSKTRGTVHDAELFVHVINHITSRQTTVFIVPHHRRTIVSQSVSHSLWTSLVHPFIQNLIKFSDIRSSQKQMECFSLSSLWNELDVAVCCLMVERVGCIGGACW